MILERKYNMEYSAERFELTHLSEIRVGNEIRWKARANFPGYRQGKSMVVFQIHKELIAIASKCPHEGYGLENARFLGEYELECTAHQNRYSLLPGGIATYRVVEENDVMYIVRHNLRREDK